MVFLDDLKDKLDTGGFSDCKIIIFERGAYVEGHGGVVDFSGGAVVFKLKKKRLRIEGRDFRLSCIARDAASVRGRVDAVFFDGPE
jgi:sporulation protein YqfC